MQCDFNLAPNYSQLVRVVRMMRKKEEKIYTKKKKKTSIWLFVEWTSFLVFHCTRWSRINNFSIYAIRAERWLMLVEVQDQICHYFLVSSVYDYESKLRKIFFPLCCRHTSEGRNWSDEFRVRMKIIWKNWFLDFFLLLCWTFMHQLQFNQMKNIRNYPWHFSFSPRWRMKIFSQISRLLRKCKNIETLKVPRNFCR